MNSLQSLAYKVWRAFQRWNNDKFKYALKS